ncbi:MAG TPA: hypothetical protein P5514_05030 [Bacteroidales bacterium]|nr:hypothetical protein [Bacteroidales bacterium]HRX96286.1 hypothetical protein [Bacteroidales bacterium]
MDQSIKSLQELWHHKKVHLPDADMLITKLNQAESRSRHERLILWFSLPLTIVLLMILLPVFESAYFLFALLFSAFGMLMILWQMHKTKFSKIENDAQFNNSEFIQHHISKLKRKMLITSRYMWIYAFLLLAGINIGYLEAIENLDIEVRFLIHLTISGLLIFFFYKAIQKRKRNNIAELVPLIDLLKSMKNED